MPKSKTFSGFDSSQQGWFEVPNEWTDICAEISSLAELKVVQYVMRHTWGSQEYGSRKRINVDEFINGRRSRDGDRMDKGTGLSKSSVIAGLRRAVEHGLLVEEIDGSDKGRGKKSYFLRVNPEGMPGTEKAEAASAHSAKEEIVHAR